MEIESKNFFKILTEFEERYKLNSEKVMKYGMVKLIDRLFDFMPSKTKSLGQKAVRKDFSEQFIDAKYFANNFVSRKRKGDIGVEQELIRSYFRNGEFDKLKLIQTKPGGLFQTVDFNPSTLQTFTETRGAVLSVMGI